LSALKPTFAQTQEGVTIMFKLTLRYTRYILSSLATIGFGISSTN
jgi:hypothetical protein